jgi:hypothetical protein
MLVATTNSATASVQNATTTKSVMRSRLLSATLRMSALGGRKPSP